MSTLAEIEKAIETLPAPQVDELVAWLLRRRATDAGMRSDRSVQEFVGRFSSGQTHGADNVDADLAREAARGL